MTTPIRQLTTDEVNTLGQRALTDNDDTLASLVNEVLYQRSRSRGGVLEITSLVSMRTGDGMVQFEMGDTRIQMTIAEAREHAVTIIEAAMAAETDALLMRFLRDRVKLTLEAAQAALGDFRTMRQP